FLSANGTSNAPGTRTTSMSPGSAPCFTSVPTAASRSRSTMNSLKRDATTAKRRPRALYVPSTVLTRSSMALARSPLLHVLDDLETESREPVHVLRRGQHAHPPHAERAQHLRAGADRSEIHHAVAPRGDVVDRLAELLHDAHQIARRLVLPEQHDHAVPVLRDPPHRVAQRPTEPLVLDSDHVAQRFLAMHAHKRRRFRIDTAADERDVNGAIHVILEAHHLERPDLRLDVELADRLDRFLFLEAVLDQVGDR